MSRMKKKEELTQSGYSDVLTDEELDAVLAANLKLSVPDRIQVSEDLIQRTLKAVEEGAEVQLRTERNTDGGAERKRTGAAGILRLRKPLAAAAAVLCLAFLGASVYIGGRGANKADNAEIQRTEAVLDAETGAMPQTTAATTAAATVSETADLVRGEGEAESAAGSITEATEQTAANAQDVAWADVLEGSGNGSAKILRAAELVSVYAGDKEEGIELTEEQAELLAAAFEQTGSWEIRKDEEDQTDPDAKAEMRWRIEITDAEREQTVYYTLYSDGTLQEEYAGEGEAVRRKYVPEQMQEVEERLKDFAEE
ncbi:MAG: hypothetical protein J6B85_09555 [Lachnospiraceae bacterium]|nr:hypothetical protein [Lachnospiraceae bacterium]